MSLDKALVALLLTCTNLLTTALSQPADTLEAKQHLILADTLYSQKLYDSAAKAYHAAAVIYIRARFYDRAADANWKAGNGYFFGRNYDSAHANYFKSSLNLLQVYDEMDPELSRIYNSLGAVLNQQGKYYQAKKWLLKSLQIKELHLSTSDLGFGLSCYNLGLTTMYFGEHQKSLEYFQRAQPIYLEQYGEHGRRLGNLYDNIGILYERKGDRDRAIEYYQKSIEIYQHDPESTWNLAYPYHNLGSVYSKAKDYEKALPLLMQCRQISQANNLYRLESIVSASIGKIYHEDGDYDQALKYYQEAIDLMVSRFGEEHPRLRDYYQFKGDTYQKMGSLDKAEENYQKALEILYPAFGKVHPKVAGTFRGLGSLRLESGDVDGALRSYQEGMVALSPSFENLDILTNPNIQEVMDNREFLELLVLKAKAFEARFKKSGDIYDQFYSYLQYHDAIKLMDHMRRGYISEASKLYLQERAMPIYEKAIAICLQLDGQIDSIDFLNEAFAFSEKNKATILAEAMQGAEIRSFRDINQSTLSFEKNLSQQIIQNQKRLADVSLTNEKDSLLAGELKSELFDLQFSYDSLAARIAQDHPDYFDLRYATPEIQIGRIQSQLDFETAVLSYFLGDSSIYVFKILSTAANILRLDRSEFPDEQLRSLHKAVSSSGSSYSEFANLSYRLYSQLIAKSLDGQNDIKRLIIIPDGVLSYIPFETLITRETYDLIPSFLIADFSISYSYSAGLLFREGPIRELASNPYVGFAPEYPELGSPSAQRGDRLYREDPVELAGTVEEVSFARSIFGGEAFLAGEATETNLKRMAQFPAILHLAMHATVDDKDPMNSRFLFAPEEDSLEDGMLNAYEIYDLKLNSNLAVLSACNTGFGEINRGEGVMSLSRAFTYAGCPSIVMSLWRAKDQPTTQIMNRFFELLHSGETKDDALRLAKLSFLEQADPHLKHPANWGTFVLIGDPAALPTEGQVWMWILGLGVLLVLWFAFRRGIPGSTKKDMP